MRLLFGYFFDGNRSHARRCVHINELFRGRIPAGNQQIAEQNRERLVPHQILCHQHGVPQAQRLLLPRVAYLHHVTDPPHHRGLFFLPSLFQEALQRRRMVEVVFDRILSLAGHDDDVLDPRHHALFHDVLNLGLVDDRQHFLGLRFCGRQKTCPQPRGRQNCLAHSASCADLRLRCVSHRSPRWTYFFFAVFFSFDSLEAVSFVAGSFALVSFSLLAPSFVSVAGFSPLFPAPPPVFFPPQSPTHQTAPLNLIPRAGMTDSPFPPHSRPFFSRRPDTAFNFHLC